MSLKPGVAMFDILQRIRSFQVLKRKTKTEAFPSKGRSLSRLGSENRPKWLEAFPLEGGFSYISSARTFAHDETKYDEQYRNAPDMGPGTGLVALLRERDADFKGPAIEIGCGTGHLSLGLVQAGAYPAVVLTDPSPMFLNITSHKLTMAAVDGPGVHLAVLKAEELGRLPGDEFSLIFLRSVLHHVLDVVKFIDEAAMSLRSGGILTFQEPCMEGYVLMGAMAQFIPLVMEKSDVHLSVEQKKHIRRFVEAMQFYARRDLDKSGAEDKHLFRVDEIMKISSAAGLTTEFLPNMTYEQFVVPAEKRHENPSFYAFFHDYLKYCMSFGPELMGLFDRHFRDYCGFVEDLSASSSGPYMHGVFICRKR